MHALALLLVLVTAATTPATRRWDDVPRDVYVDGKLDRSVQTLVTDSPRMLAFVCGDQVVVFDPAAKSVSRTSRASFSFAADRTSATTATELAAERVGELARPTSSTYVADAGGKSLVVVSHQSKAGVMTLDELWQTMPVWRSIADHYEPDANAVARLRAITEPVRLEVVLATWCGDSKRHVPRLLKAVEAANNPNVTVELIGIGPDFETPMEMVQRANVTNVPTVIVRRGESEIGRYVETPAAATIEEDVADIVHRTQKAHAGRWARRNELARGTYALRGRDAGTERFTLYDTESGGVVAHSVIRRTSGASVETWATYDKERKPVQVEVTYRDAVGVTRTRYFKSGEQWTGHARGIDGGIVNQTVLMPATIVTPATVTWGWAGSGSTYIVAEKGVGEYGASPSRRLARRRPAGAIAVPQRVWLTDGSQRVLTSYAESASAMAVK